MKPTALLITMDRYPKVRELLKAQQASAPGSVDVRLKLAETFEEVFTAVRESVDLVVLDGHGFVYQGVPFFGTDDGDNGVEFAPTRLRGEKGMGSLRRSWHWRSAMAEQFRSRTRSAHRVTPAW